MLFCYAARILKKISGRFVLFPRLYSTCNSLLTVARGSLVVPTLAADRITRPLTCTLLCILPPPALVPCLFFKTKIPRFPPAVAIESSATPTINPIKTGPPPLPPRFGSVASVFVSLFVHIRRVRCHTQFDATCPIVNSAACITALPY